MQTTLQDLTYAVRALRRAPGFAAVTILTLALGIGANTAVFTVVNALVLRPLPYPNADRLVMIWQDLRARGGPPDEWASPGNFVDWGTALAPIERVAAIVGWRPIFTGEVAEPDALTGEQVSHEYLSVLGRTPALGRDFAAADDVPGARRVVIIGDGLWRRRFGAEPSAVGRQIVLAGEPHEIIGVLPAGVRPIVAAEAEVWRPLRLNRAAPARGAVILRTVARLAPGTTLVQAQEAATTLARRLETDHPDYNQRTGVLIEPLRERVTGQIRPALLALAGAVAFVLLIACANIANLLLARSSVRRRELATRVALGAGRGRMIRQLVTESLVVAAAGGVAGFVLGLWGVDVLVAMAPADAPRLDEVRIDTTVLAMTALLTAVTGLVVGLAPALQQSFNDVASTLKDGGRGTAGSSRSLRGILVSAEVALALVLLTGGVLLVQTFTRLQSADLGFRTEGVLVGTVLPPQAAYDAPAKIVSLYDQVLERAAAIPGVQRAALSSVLPLDGGDSDMSFAIIGRPPAALAADEPVTWYRLVSAGYFDAIGMRIARGRAFAGHEAAPAVLVNETFVRRHFAGEEPLGRQIRFGGPDRAVFTIVGVVADIRGRGAREEARVETFIPYWHFPERDINIVLTGATPDAWRGSLRQAVAAVDPALPVVGIRTMSETLGASISQPRFLATLAGGFAGLALLLAALGIYGVMAYAVAQRTTEIGVRMALGASASEVFRLVIGDGVRLAAAGVVLGVTGAVLAARALATQLFAVEPTDPVRLGGMATLILAVVVVACLVPAWRAMRVDPVEALRAD